MSNKCRKSGDTCNLEWPTRGMKLFTSGSPRQTLAWLPPYPEAYIVSEGYVMAADLMVERIESKPPGDIDFFIWPIAFCYRQAIELELKEALVVARRLTRSSADFPAGHDLCQLWSALKTELTLLILAVNGAEIRALDSLIHEFHSKDPQSFKFRYTRDKSGQPLRKKHEQIQLAALSHGCRAVRNWLDALTSMLIDLEGSGP